MKCPVKDECLFTALELIQRGETIKGIWGGLSAVQLRRALNNPESIPKMRGQRSRAKTPPAFLVPAIPSDLLPAPRNGDGEDVFMDTSGAHINIEALMKAKPSSH